LLFRQRDKELMLFRFNRYAIVGLLCPGMRPLLIRAREGRRRIP
jgi:hypothetical protein